MNERTGLDWKQAVREYPLVCITTNGSLRPNGNGILGAGVARAARELFPNIETAAGLALHMHGNVPGPLGYGRPEDSSKTFYKWYEDIAVDSDPWQVPSTTWIWSFPVKHRIEDAADIQLVIQSMKLLDWDLSRMAGDFPVAIPRPGCGVGGLHWEYVKKVLQSIGFGDRYVFFTNEPA